MLCAPIGLPVAGHTHACFRFARSDAPRSVNNQPPRTKREHFRRLVEGKNLWDEPLSEEDKARGFLGWHERGYLPHCDKPGLAQFVTFRLADSMPESRRGEWEHLLKVIAPPPYETDATRSDAPRSGAQSIALRDETKRAERERARREQRVKLEEYLDRGHGECHLRNPQVAALVEQSIRFHDARRFRLLAWVVMPNHAHVLVEIWQTPLSKVMQNWKSITAVGANKILGRTGTFWQPEYWDHFMRSEEQTRKTIRYIESNPVKANLCRTPEAWPHGSARFRDEKTGELRLPPT